MMAWDGWGNVAGLFMIAAVWGSIVALIVWVILLLTRRKTHSRCGKQSPLDIARERYARGEINKEQFEQLKKDLA